ncbi:MAG: hypothetical protein B0D92_00460 [Spirochaeta sp. LUC14_002_19_P3]|nr:MAG: hypothetical protein B0D92_00460 [Spirochaeta sp. LUC14_002_19_P3]
MENYIGLDIGTTSVSAILLNLSTGQTLTAETRPHKAWCADSAADEYLLDAEKVFQLAQNMADSIIRQYPVKGIGITGQMHGILLLNISGRAVSPAYTWLDMRASRHGPNGLSYAEELSQLTGTSIQPGYGAATLYTLKQTQSIPPQAVSFCTIPDYIAMRLSEKTSPLMDSTQAHSLGYFNPNVNSFQNDLWRETTSLPLPEIADPAALIGSYRHIPVTTAVGDNQAGFLSSVRKGGSGILVNVGTSGQICFLESPDKPSLNSSLEIRPFFTGERLLVGASLTGGKSFEVLTTLIENVASRSNSSINPYDILDSFTAPPTETGALKIKTAFKGTRRNPEETGSISGITLNNFTLERLYWGIAAGIIDELHSMIDPNHEILQKPDLFIAVAGNAIKKNPALAMELKKRFNAPILIPQQEESAAQGAAIIAAAAVHGGAGKLEEFSTKAITYKEWTSPKE